MVKEPRFSNRHATMVKKPQTHFKSVVEQRRSTRKFEPGREVDRDVLDRIVDCGRWAPRSRTSSWA